jgi:hypothetical protein
VLDDQGKIIDVNNWYKTQDTLNLSEKFIGKDKDNKDVNVDVPIGSTTFDASQPKGKEWNYNILGRKYTVTSVIANTEDRDRTISYNQIVVDVDGKTYKVPVESQVQEIFPTPSWGFYMHPDIGITGGLNTNFGFSSVASITTPFLKYGVYKRAPEFTFLSVGLGADIINKDISIVFQPVNYNIGSLIKFLNHTYLTAGISYGITKKEASFDIGIKIAL